MGWVSSRFFETFGAKPLRGRNFGLQDTAESLQVVLVNRSFAEKYWPGQDPVGRRIRLADSERGEDKEPWRTVIGVVPQDLGMVNLGDDEPEAQGVYIPEVPRDCPASLPGWWRARARPTRWPSPTGCARAWRRSTRTWPSTWCAPWTRW